MTSITVSLLMVLLALSIGSTNAFFSKYCLPGEDCWPEMEDIVRLNDSLVGAILLPRDPGYRFEGLIKDTYYSKDPGIIAIMASQSDVQNALLFARKFSIRVTIYSSGHGYNGRSTADGSLQINMAHMKNIDINLHNVESDTGASITVETGNSWERIYKEVDKVGKVVVGGSAHTVSPGGYAAGGGHSPICRCLGLAADNVIAVTLVLADGSVAYLNSTGTIIKDQNGQSVSSSDTELFWASRGGGGGTFGIVINYTFKLHDPPTQLVQYLAGYPMDLQGNATQGQEVIRFIHQLIPSLPKEWGGYFVYVSTPQYARAFTGLVLISMLHYGPWDAPGMRSIDPLVNFHPERQIFSALLNHTTFWQYEKSVNDAVFTHGYVANSLLPERKLTPTLTEFYAGFILNNASAINTSRSCTETMIGGKVSESHDNPVSDNFREALLSTTCSVNWIDPRDDSVGGALGKELANSFYTFSQGVYVNEAAYDLLNWRADFWGDKFIRLWIVKRKYDPTGVFYCRHCIGDYGDTASDSDGNKALDVKMKTDKRKNKLIEVMEQSFAQ